MNKVLASIIPFVFFSCLNENDEEVNTISALDSHHVFASISMPKGSGLAFVPYSRHEIIGNKYHHIERSQPILIQDSIHYAYDTIATYNVSLDNQIRLTQLIEKTDSLGYHSPTILMHYGWPRFYINVGLDNKHLDGFIANCYREHIFNFVDLFNDCNPKGNILSYDIKKLNLTELKLAEDGFDWNNEKDSTETGFLMDELK